MKLNNWKPFHSGLFNCFCLLLFVLSAVTHVYGQDEERITVRVDGRTVFRVGEMDDLSAAERVQRIERRMNTLLETPAVIVPSRIEQTGETEYVISVAGVPVVTVTESDAEDNVVSADALAGQWARAIDNVMLPARDRRTTRWGRFSADVQASVQAAFSRLLESAIRVVPRTLAALLVIGLFWIVASALRKLMTIIFSRIVKDITAENLIRQFTYYFIWIIGLLVAVDAFGLNPQTVVTGLGLTGLALGFALKDIISNFVSGILILTLRPFRLGDQIIVHDTEGTVERIQLRATEIRTYDGVLVLVPNSEVFTSRVTNNTASPLRRANVVIHLAYDVDLPAVFKILCQSAQQTPGVLARPEVSVLVRELDQTNICLQLRFWTDSRRADFLETTSKVQTAVVDALRTAGIALPDPGKLSVRLLSDAQGDGAQPASSA